MICSDPRNIHPHICKACGKQMFFSITQCRAFKIFPPCPECGETNWGDEFENVIEFPEVPKEATPAKDEVYPHASLQGADWWVMVNKEERLGPFNTIFDAMAKLDEMED